jgi:glutamate dehydrogenase
MFNSDFALPQLPVLRKLFQDHGLILKRAYWEPYCGKASAPSSICSLYTQGELSRKKESHIIKDLCAYLALHINEITDLYAEEKLTFQEMLFSANAVDFTHMFIFKESKNRTDQEIISSLDNPDHKDAFAERIHESNKSTYLYKIVLETAKQNPDLLKYLYGLFENRFDPRQTDRLSDQALAARELEFDKILAVRFIDFRVGYEIFKFMFKMVSSTLKTNFYKTEKRSYAFRLDNRILDTLVFNQSIFGIFYVNGHYACGTHLRADDIARGGLRLIRVSPANHATELDNAVMLNYALGPKAQRLKHKDICESGSKGVVVPHPIYAGCSMDSLFDYTEGIMDLMLEDDAIVDYYGKPEMIFFGPDEGTAPLMDAVAYRARERNYKYWRTITTGKSFGIPHDAYGLLENGDVFGLLERQEQGTELQINGKPCLTTRDMDQIYEKIGGKIKNSGMTTTGVMGAFRTLIDHYGVQEEELNLMITGGPDGDLGANEIQSYKGRICLIMDGGSILFDPMGLDKKELMKIAFMRHSSPRSNSLAYPPDRLSEQGFMVPLRSKNITLPDGTFLEDGAIFHKTFLTETSNRRFIEQADIKVFIPCGGFKDTINHNNVHDFLALFQELKFIVEGANVFFDDAARRYIATATNIKQIKDTTANKGGVFSSSVAEVLTAFLFNDDYDRKLMKETATRWALIKDIMALVTKYSQAETAMLIKIHEHNPTVPLFDLSEKTSEQIFALQDVFETRISDILANTTLVWKIMEEYIPAILITKLGHDKIMRLFNSQNLQAYRNAILTKKLASMAFYRYGTDWDGFLEKINDNFQETVNTIIH